MKANIEQGGKGVVIESESPEESLIMRQLWEQGPQAVGFTKKPNGYFDVTIAPVAAGWKMKLEKRHE